MSNSIYREVNFDGLVGPTHHFGGLGYGNIASDKYKNSLSHPRRAALQGLEKMEFLFHLGIPQAIIPPQVRPDIPRLRSKLNFSGNDKQLLKIAYDENPELLSALSSASCMWTANAATITSSQDSSDSKLHITPANLSHQLHRSIESTGTHDYFQRVFANLGDKVNIHPPLDPSEFGGDEGAANFVRLSKSHQERGINLFVYGNDHEIEKDKAVKFKGRQSHSASRQIVNSHKLIEDYQLIIRQNPEVVDQGVFHNDVISVGNENVFLVHEESFENTSECLENLNSQFKSIYGVNLKILLVKNDELLPREAVDCYLFNSQIVTKPSGKMILICPMETHDNPRAKSVIDGILLEDNPIDEVKFFALKQSMQNGGGPACLRLRILLNQDEFSHLHQGILLNEEKIEKLKNWVNLHYAEDLTLETLSHYDFYLEMQAALLKLEKILNLSGLLNIH